MLFWNHWHACASCRPYMGTDQRRAPAPSSASAGKPLSCVRPIHQRKSAHSYHCSHCLVGSASLNTTLSCRHPGPALSDPIILLLSTPSLILINGLATPYSLYIGDCFMAEAEQRWNERLCLGASVPPPPMDSGVSRFTPVARHASRRGHSGNIKTLMPASKRENHQTTPFPCIFHSFIS